MESLRPLIDLDRGLELERKLERVLEKALERVLERPMVVVAHEILVSAQVPLVLGLGLRVWGLGLTIIMNFIHVLFKHT